MLNKNQHQPLGVGVVGGVSGVNPFVVKKDIIQKDIKEKENEKMKIPHEDKRLNIFTVISVGFVIIGYIVLLVFYYFNLKKSNSSKKLNI